MINSFSGENRFLSNFYPSKIKVGEYIAITVEHAYQACKTDDWEEALWVLSTNDPGVAKKRGQKVTLRKNWDGVKDETMFKLLEAKFKIPELAEKLIATGNQKLVEGNTWGDTYWGVCNGIGQNKLGEMLMEIRRIIS